MTGRLSTTSRDIAIAAVVFALAAPALVLLHQRTAPHYRLSAAAAIAAARANPGDAAFLAKHPGPTAHVIPLDPHHQRVTFFNGPHVILDAAVDERGQVTATEMHPPGVPQSGGTLANAPGVLALLTALFLLATTVVPLRRLRNLDALALASFTLTIVLINDRLVAASVISASVALAYLAFRCLYVGLGPAGRAQPAATPTYAWLTARWDAARAARILGLILGTAVLAFLMITLTSNGESDVAAASLSGATDLLHGVLPYGHIQDAVHGDTYPLLNYILYIPGALWLPVTDAFSDLSGALPIVALGGLATALALHRLAADRRGTARLNVVLAWVAFPPMVLAAAGGSNDLVLAALLAWMLVADARPAPRTLLLAMAAWVKLVPLVLAPLWLARSRRRTTARALLAPGALSAALLAWLLVLGGTPALGHMISAMSFQFERGSFYAPWYTFGIQWLQAPLQAAVLAFLAVGVLRVRRDAGLRADRVRLAALGGALLLGVQLTANYWSWSYLPWVFPFVAVALLLGARPAPPRREPSSAPREDRTRLVPPTRAARDAWLPVA